jgi:hypothetical protein
VGERQEEALELLLSDPAFVAWLEPDERDEDDDEEGA